MPLAHVSPSGLRGGDHALAVTRSDSELQWLARSFIETAERAGARALYLSEGPAEETTSVLGLPSSSRPGGLVVEQAAPVLAPAGRFEPDRVHAALEQAVQDARRDGFTGVHIFVEVGWTLNDIEDVQRRDHLEASAHEFDVMREGDAVFLCQYSEGRFSGDALERALGSHPVVVDAGSQELRASAPARIWLQDDVVYIWGELDRTTAQLVGAPWLAVGNTVTIDLAETTFFDVGAYRALRTIAEGGCRVTLRNAPPVVRRVVEILNDQPGIELSIEDEPIRGAVER